MPTNFIISFTTSMMDKVIADKGNNDKEKLVRYVIGFIKNLKKMKAINLQDIQEKLVIFLEEFKTIDEVKELQQIKNSLAKE